MIESLRKLGTAFGPDLEVPGEATTTTGAPSLQAAEELANRLISIFTATPRDGVRHTRAAANSRGSVLARPPLFYEYFHAGQRRRLGASHQAGWTALVRS